MTLVTSFHGFTQVTCRVLTWSGHALADCQRIFAAPLVQFLLHLLHLGWVQRPKAALSGGVSTLVLHFLKALVQRQVMTNGVLPSVRGRLEEGIK